MATETKKQAVRVLIVDDHPSMRRALQQLIEDEPDLDVCGLAGSVSEGFEMIKHEHPEVALIDLTLPDGDGIDLIRRIRSIDKQVKLLVVSMHDESIYGRRARLAGAEGYVNKQEAAEHLLDEIRRVSNHETE